MQQKPIRYRFAVILFVLFCYINNIVGSSTIKIPFSTDSTNITIWNGQSYEPFFLKGVNFGIAKPGTYPGELLATRSQYQQWFSEIKDAGFNCIRLYTLLFPEFYEELRNYNISHKQHPLFFFQGVWLNEEMAGYHEDLYQLADTFKVEAEENIDCLHGNKTIKQRFGKAYGTYTADVSDWLIGFIIGREIYPTEIITSNTNHPEINSFTGNHFSISAGSAAEVLFTKNLDHVVSFENDKYNMQHPVSFSSWPTLDPIVHKSEPNRLEDTVSVDLSKLTITNAPAGFFISYHAYPYYPDFIGNDPGYLKFTDSYGTNSYLGYLTDLKSHYKQYPLIIAEYGVPSSWGVAHYSTSGMNHGGFDELSQGETDIRLLNNIKTAKTGGGIQFSWIDEWFKKTWITDPFDFGNRILWHNLTGAEQNFGLVKFNKEITFLPWKTFGTNDEINYLKGEADFEFFQMEIGLKNQMDVLGECWIALDTYDATLGESILPDGTHLPTRAEFALHITPHSAELYVTEAYDLFGIWHKQTTTKQKFQSTVTDGAPWQLVRWKNNSGNSDVQYIGNLTLNRSFQPESSKDAVTIFPNKIRVRLPWSLLQVVDPSNLTVFHDNKSTADVTETRITDGIAVSIDYKNKLYNSDTRFIWPGWSTVRDADVNEIKKTSYWTMYDRLIEFNTPAISLPDTFDFSTKNYPYSIDFANGVLKNDFDMDGQMLVCVLTESPSNGFVSLNADGSFTYLPKSGFEGTDVFTYAIFDGQSLSKPSKVTLKIPKNLSHPINNGGDSILKVYPNPATDFAKIESTLSITTLRLFDMSGKMLIQIPLNQKEYSLNLNKFKNGIYYLVAEIGGRVFANKLMIK
jgi:hypothetical protein